MFPRTTQVAVIILASLFVVGATILLAMGRSIDQFVTFAAWLVPVLVGVAFNSHQINDVRRSTGRIERRVNGELTQAIKETINEVLNEQKEGDDNGTVV